MNFSETAKREALALIDNMNAKDLEDVAAAVALKIIQRKNEEHKAAIAQCLAIAASAGATVAEVMGSRRPWTRRKPRAT